MTHKIADVALVGLGNIGLRHLQGLRTIAPHIRLWGVDPNPDARTRAAQEWEPYSVEEGGFVESVTQLQPGLQTAIIATSARGRFELLCGLLPKLHGSALVLEKVAFSSIREMDAAGELLQTTGKTATVNCARRLWPLYRYLSGKLVGQRFDLSVRGRNLGLGSNGIHFLDLLQMLAGVEEIHLTSWAGRSIIPSKRAGYFEARGVLEAATANGSTIAISVLEDDPASIEISLRIDAGSVVVDELRGAVSSALVWEGGRPPYQSELSGGIVRQILGGKGSGLSSFTASRGAHKVLFSALADYFSQGGIDTSDGVPVT